MKTYYLLIFNTEMAEIFAELYRLLTFYAKLAVQMELHRENEIMFINLVYFLLYKHYNANNIHQNYSIVLY